jgi:hypothetical protein
MSVSYWACRNVDTPNFGLVLSFDKFRMTKLSARMTDRNDGS